MFGFLTSLFKHKKDKDVQELLPVVEQIKAEHAKLQGLSDDDLRALSDTFRKHVRAALEPIQNQIAAQKQKAEALARSGDTGGSEDLFLEVDKLKKDLNKATEDALNQILPRAFAVVKETCARLVKNGKLVVKATDYDRQMAEACKRRMFQNVTIEGEMAHWHNQWEVMGNVVKWDMVHYDVQLIGGVVLHSGKIAEMTTGEGKTLVATLPAYLNALTGRGLHIVTVNDYLARRDMEWNAPIFQFHGIRVDCVDLHQPNSNQRRAAYYDADITYGTNNEFGFDYLRDNMALHPNQLVQREHHYAIVDEIDSVLIDEARTPLIISGPVPQGDKHEFHELKPAIERIITRQKQIVQDALNQAKSLITKGDTKQGGDFLFRAYRGMPQYGPVIKYLSEDGIRSILQKAEAVYLADNQRKMPEMDEHLLFWVDEKHREVEMTDQGREFITPRDQPDYFILPDIGSELAALDSHPEWTPEEVLLKKEELSRNYTEKSERLHSIKQLLRAYTIYQRDVDYVIENGKIMIVDENTGRAMQGRRWSDGLHQAVEAKENVKVEELTQTYATITLQNYFRMYHKLAGMTGTAETEANEFHEIYKLDVVVIPTNRPIVRKDIDDKVYRTEREKFNAIVEEITQLANAGRPVLVGTTSVETSEKLSRFLGRTKIKHEVLNAKQHAREAEIVAEAGQAPKNAEGKRIGNVTIATNMAGRGTDIKLGEGVREAGGLAIIGTERHQSRRIDLQLRGRSGRQGDPGSSQFFVSLEDDLMRQFGSERIARVMNWLKVPEGEVIQHKMITKQISNAQRKVEENHFSMRKRLLEYDDVMNKQREVIYSRRNNALYGDRIKVDLNHIFEDTAHSLAENYAGTDEAEALMLNTIRTFALDIKLSARELMEMRTDKLSDVLFRQADSRYKAKTKSIAERVYEKMSADAEQEKVRLGDRYEQDFLSKYLLLDMTDHVRAVRYYVPIREVLETKGQVAVTEFEKTVVLGIIDDKWKEHLRIMDELRENVKMAQFEQKDPLLIYKQEAYKAFMEAVDNLNKEMVSMLCRSDLMAAPPAQQTPAQQQQIQQQQQQQRRADLSRLRAQHTDSPGTQRRQSSAPTHIQGEDGSERKLSRAERRMVERNEAKRGGKKD